MTIESLMPKWLDYAKNIKGLSHREISKKANIDYKYLFQLKSGKRKPRRETISKICEVIGITFEEYAAGVETYKASKEPITPQKTFHIDYHSDDTMRVKMMEMITKLEGKHLQHAFESITFIYECSQEPVKNIQKNMAQ